MSRPVKMSEKSAIYPRDSSIEEGRRRKGRSNCFGDGGRAWKEGWVHDDD